MLDTEQYTMYWEGVGVGYMGQLFGEKVLELACAYGSSA